MTLFDLLAGSSRFKGISPACKAGASLFTMAVCLCVSHTFFSVCVFAVVSVLCVCGSGVPFRRWVSLCAVPFFFLLVGCVMVAISFSTQPGGVLCVPVAGAYLTVTHVGLADAIRLFCRAMACVAALYFLCVTTPMGHILGLLERIHTPKLLVELAMMIYRFIFILTELSAQMAVAQRARLGGATFGARLRSVAALASTLLVRAMQKSTRIFDAMESRCYTGEMIYTGELPAFPMWQRAALGGYAVALTALGVAAGMMAR